MGSNGGHARTQRYNLLVLQSAVESGPGHSLIVGVQGADPLLTDPGQGRFWSCPWGPIQRLELFLGLVLLPTSDLCLLRVSDISDLCLLRVSDM